MKFSEQKGISISDAFARFHLEHPEVYFHFSRYVSDMILEGYMEVSAKLIVNRLRWEVFRLKSGEVILRIDESFTTHYSRLYVQDHPEHASYFRILTLRNTEDRPVAQGETPEERIDRMTDETGDNW